MCLAKGPFELGGGGRCHGRRRRTPGLGVLHEVRFVVLSVLKDVPSFRLRWNSGPPPGPPGRTCGCPRQDRVPGSVSRPPGVSFDVRLGGFPGVGRGRRPVLPNPGDLWDVGPCVDSYLWYPGGRGGGTDSTPEIGPIPWDRLDTPHRDRLDPLDRPDPLVQTRPSRRDRLDPPR